jgi:hypothetical protein
MLISNVGEIIWKHTSHHDQWSDLLPSCPHTGYLIWRYFRGTFWSSLVWCNYSWWVWNSGSWCSSDVRFAPRLGGAISGCL